MNAWNNYRKYLIHMSPKYSAYYLIRVGQYIMFITQIRNTYKYWRNKGDRKSKGYVVWLSILYMLCR